MMKKNLKYLLALLCIIVLLLCTGCSSDNDAPQPISITVWTYYNGTLLESFNALVKTFNETVGKEKGIMVEAYSHGWMYSSIFSAPETQMCRGALYDSAFAAAGIPIYDNTLYDNHKRTHCRRKWN